MSENPIWNLHLLEGRRLQGSIASVPDNATLCFSIMVPITPISGCTLVKNAGGYIELSFPNGAGEKCFSFAFAQEEFKVHNIGWLPWKPYFRLGDGRCQEVEIDFTPPYEAPVPCPEVAPFDGLQLVPQPTSWTAAQGTLDMHAGLQCAPDLPFAEALTSAQDLAARNTLLPLLGTGPRVTITRDYDGPAEGYRLEMTPTGAHIRANARSGAFHAAISLLNLTNTYEGKVPCGMVEDCPRFEWRGQQLDCARHFYQPETLMRLLDLLALLKLNRFHWHFSDDESFRLEVECYPEIWQKTRLRGEGELLPGLFGGGIGPTGGSYTLEFARDLIARAKALEIEVLPEIEIPAHAYALIQVFPDLYDADDTSAEESVQGYIGNTMNPAKPFMWELVENLTRELAGIFPFAHIHLGCDEPPVKAWSRSPAAQALMAQESLETRDDLLGWTMEKAGKIVRGFNCRPCAWEEAGYGANGGIGNDAILFSWSGKGPGLDAARRGYKVVMSPAQHLYFDMSKSPRFEDRGGVWAGTLALEDTVVWQPVPADEPELEENIIGVEGAFWGEFTTQDLEMEQMVAPRILGLAETAWRSKEDPADATSIAQAAAFYEGVFQRIGWGRA